MFMLWFSGSIHIAVDIKRFLVRQAGHAVAIGKLGGRRDLAGIAHDLFRILFQEFPIFPVVCDVVFFHEVFVELPSARVIRKASAVG